MLPWKTIISIDRSSNLYAYLQLVNTVIQEIKEGVIKPGTKMPGTRVMSDLLNLHRQTVVKAYDELYSQGWLISIKSKGTFVSEKLPEVTPKKFTSVSKSPAYAAQTGYSFRIDSRIHEPARPLRELIGFHDGPDVRLVPADLLSRGYKSVMRRKSGLLLLSYTERGGGPKIKEAISDYLNSSRGLQTASENIIVTRGSQMGLFLLAMILISKDDIVIAGDLSFRYADLVFIYAGAKMQRIPVDENGIDVDALEKICKRKKIRAVYVTPHHHYPTTVILSAARRMKLLHLAEQYRFIIIEDDYDYEFHFERSPILPLASADRNGMVVYIGSFSKTLSPAIRIGYVAAPVDLILELCKLRQIIDVQGDPVLEQVIAEMLEEGEIRRHMKKSLKIYRERRDHLCDLLRDKLSDVVDFAVPEGGLSVWTKYDKRISVPQLSENLKKKGVALSKGLIHDMGVNKKHNSTRMGYGWMNLQEADKAVSILEEAIRGWK